MALGAPLPMLPLWLRDRMVIPLELESAYRETCEGFGIEFSASGSAGNDS